MRKRKQIIWIAILGIIVAVAAWRIFIPGQTEMAFEQSTVNQNIVVHMAGAVKNPGLVTLPLDARMSDALEAAGLQDDADSDVINLAQKLKDGQRIYIPFKGENAEVAVDGGTEPDSGTGAAGTRVSAGSGTSGTGVPGGKVNINTASQKQLESLPGVGPVTAERIVAYRQENGMFTSIEELMNIQGIGQKKFEALADSVTVGP